MRKSFVRLLAVSFGAAMLLASSYALAQSAAGTQAAPGATPGQGLEISPPVIELTADPGQTVTSQIRVRNVTSAELIAKAEVDDFGASTNESGTPQILTDDTGADRFALKLWIPTVANLDLAPGELKTTTVTVRVPSNAEPGGHYGVVRFTAVPANLNGSGVSLSASVGSLILMRVNGAVTDNLNVVQFATGTTSSKGVWATNSFFEHGPMQFLVRLHNGGSVHEKATGTITVKNMFGGKPVTLAVNPNGGNVLPDSIRRFTNELTQKTLFGHYTATLAMTYAGNKPLSASLSFWVIPWKLILLVIVGLTVVGYLLKLGLRKYNDHIIAQARRRR